jgi:hemerythrin
MAPLLPSPAHTAAAALRHARKLLFVRLHAHTAAPDADFCAGFEAVVAAIEADLAHEEKVMEALAFDGLHARLAENALLLASLHCVVTQVETGNAALGRTALAAACDLLSLHRLTTDLALVLARASTTPAPLRGHRIAGGALGRKRKT